MTYSEFDPIIDGLQDAKQLGAWLVAHKARLDVSECQGLAANRLVVPDPSQTGQWVIRLAGAIDMVDIDDGWFATGDPADIRVQEREGAEPVIKVLYTGIDDVLRSSTIDSTAAATFEPIQIIPNN